MTIRRSPFQLHVWSDSSKASDKTPTPVTRIVSFQGTRRCNEPYQYTITCNLTDYVLANIGRGHYFELRRTRSTFSGPDTSEMTANGYIINITKDTTAPGTYTLSCASPLWFLGQSRIRLDYYAGPGLNFSGILDLLNGVPPGSLLPEHQGLLPPGWSANWVDGVNTPATHGDFVGNGDIWKGGGDTRLLDVTSNLQRYNLQMRESTSRVNYAYDGVIDIGPLGDSSSCDIWGGAPLLADMVANHGYPASRKRADLRTAQKFGYATITNVQYQSDFSNIRNIVFAIGKDGHTFKNLCDGPPLDSGGSLQNGWTVYTPAGPHDTEPYYSKVATSHATYDGQVFSFIASPNQGHETTDGWSYGVVDTTSVAQYGPAEYFLEENGIKDSRLLLSAALGCVSYWATPVDSFIFTVAQPLTSATGTPARPAPGQTVGVHYSGQMAAVEVGADGQIGPSGTGTYTYIDYPGTSDTRAVANLMRVLQFDESYTGGQYLQVLTLGNDKRKDKRFNDALTKQLLKHRKHHPKAHSFTKHTIDGIPFLCSNSPGAWESTKDHALRMNPGGLAVSDIHHAHVFSDHHTWTFTVSNMGQLQYLDCWFAKPIDNGTLLSPNPGGIKYGSLRLAFTASPNSGTNSATSTGFYTTNDGSTWISRGKVHKSPLLDASNRITADQPIRVVVQWKDKHLSAYIHGRDDDTNDASLVHGPLAEWSDASPFSSQVLDPQNLGAIGYMLHQGTNIVEITDIHAQATIPHIKTRAADHPHQPGKTHWHNAQIDVTYYNPIAQMATVTITSHGSGTLVDDTRNTIIGDDGTAASSAHWNTSIAVPIGMWVVYNASDRLVSDGTFSVAANQFGAMSNVKVNKASWNSVYVIGRLSDAIDENTKAPWFEGIGKHTPASAVQIRNNAIHYAQMHQAHHSNGHFTGGHWRTTSAYFWGVVSIASATESTFSFVTHDGTGDAGGAGKYRIVGPIPRPTAGDTLSRILIGPHGSAFFSSTFPNATPADNLISFTTLFPGQPTAASVGAGSLAAGTYSIRYCYTKTWGGKTIETALSQVISQTVSGGSSIQFNVDLLPQGWTGLRLYVGTSPDAEQLQTNGTNYTYNAGTGVVIFGGSAAWNNSGILPSYGFYAWPAGTALTDTGGTDLKNIGHFHDVPDGGSGQYPFTHHTGHAETHGSSHGPYSIHGGEPIPGGGGSIYTENVAPKAVNHTHLNSNITTSTGTPAASGYVPTADGSGGVTWGAVSASAGVASLNGAVGAVTIAASGNGIVVSLTGSTIDIGLPAGGSTGDALRWSGSAWVSGNLPFLTSINSDSTAAQVISGTAAVSGGAGVSVNTTSGTTVIAPTGIPIIKAGTVVVTGSGSGGSNPATVFFNTAFPGGYAIQFTAEHATIQYDITIKSSGKLSTACDFNVFPYPTSDITVDWMAISGNNP